MRALPSTFDATPTIGGPLIILLLLQPPPKPLLADSKSTGADSDTFPMVLELLKSKCGSPNGAPTGYGTATCPTRRTADALRATPVSAGVPTSVSAQHLPDGRQNV